MGRVKISNIVFILCALVTLINIGLFVFQVSNLIITAWNIIPTAIVVLIVVGNIVTNLASNRGDTSVTKEQRALDSPVRPEENTRSKKENEAFYIFNTSFPINPSRLNKLIKLVFLAVFVGLAVFFNSMAIRDDYEHIVISNIIACEDNSRTEIDYAPNMSITVTEFRDKIYIVEYTLNGETYTARVRDSYSYKQADTLKLCVKDNGEFVRLYDNIPSYRLMSITSCILALLVIIGFILKLPNQYLVMLVIGYLGMGVISLLNSTAWGFWLYNDMTVFGACFVGLSLMSILLMCVLKIIYIIGKRKDSDFQIT